MQRENAPGVYMSTGINTRHYKRKVEAHYFMGAKQRGMLSFQPKKINTGDKSKNANPAFE